MTLEVFTYNDDKSFQENFNTWYYFNCIEKERYNEQPYTRDQGFKVFVGIYPDKFVCRTGDC